MKRSAPRNISLFAELSCIFHFRRSSEQEQALESLSKRKFIQETKSVRKIIHIDADSFYASVEIRNQPALKNRPVAVGGRPEHRGVVATCNYLARQYGVHSAMASARAVQLCPELVFLKPDFPLYQSVSAKMHEIFRRYTAVIQPLSLDEAYLDVTDCGLFQGSATLMAETIREEVRAELGITVSAGIAPNKFLAKVASDWNKPDGLFTVAPQQVEAFVRILPVTRINGVGRVTAQKMKGLGIETCGDLQQYSVDWLTSHFGSYGEMLYQYARGVDDRPVQTRSERKSLSVEQTFDVDLDSVPDILTEMQCLFDTLIERFSHIERRYAATKRFVKLKCHDFTQTTLEEMLSPSEPHWQNPERFGELVSAALKRHRKPIRLLGLGVRLAPLSGSSGGEQLELFSVAEAEAEISESDRV